MPSDNEYGISIDFKCEVERGELSELQSLVRLGAPGLHRFAVVQSQGTVTTILGPHLTEKTARACDRRQGKTICGIGYYLSTALRTRLQHGLPDALCEVCVRMIRAELGKQ